MQPNFIIEGVNEYQIVDLLWLAYNRFQWRRHVKITMASWATIQLSRSALSHKFNWVKPWQLIPCAWVCASDLVNTNQLILLPPSPCKFFYEYLRRNLLRLAFNWSQDLRLWEGTWHPDRNLWTSSTQNEQQLSRKEQSLKLNFLSWRHKEVLWLRSLQLRF